MGLLEETNQYIEIDSELGNKFIETVLQLSSVFSKTSEIWKINIQYNRKDGNKISIKENYV